ncbi:hypothetical protein F383_21770 [Gossypium arboreum]|uniref:Uncharacterized protein n=1 Tax=Gossypium arboreum TaxID=29729 RepID=A0A0B0ML85_GOSAR|nr:hypothetical protein F383_21770 [Gossypium arboreum]
MGCYTINVRSE